MSHRGVPSLERRRKARLYGTFPANVRGVDALGRSFQVTSLVDNISAGGLYLELPRSIGGGCRLFSLVRLLSEVNVAARGKVLREEPREHGLLGLAVRFTRARVVRLDSGADSEESLEESCYVTPYLPEDWRCIYNCGMPTASGSYAVAVELRDSKTCDKGSYYGTITVGTERKM